MGTGGETKRKASLPATVGAWLKVWTPPRDVEVAPPPSGRDAGDRGGRAGGARRGSGGADRSRDRLQQGAQPRRRRPARTRSGVRRAGARRSPSSARAGSTPPRCCPPPARRTRRSSPPARRSCAGSRPRSPRTRAPARDAGELEGRPQGTQCEPYPKRTDRADWPDRTLALRAASTTASSSCARCRDGDERRRPGRLPVPRRARLRPLRRGVVQDRTRCRASASCPTRARCIELPHRLPRDRAA